MKTLLAATLLASAGALHAQATPPPSGTSDPDAASSAHQRATTGAATPEAPATTSPEADAASSPHQHAATREKPSDAKLKMASQDGAVPATFVKKAAQDGMTEIELGKIALSKSQDRNVREFAQRMITDHGKANQELASIARGKGLEVPKTLDTEHQSMVQTMNSKSGKAFDAAYSEHMNDDHAKAVAMFQGAVDGSDPQLAAFAKKTLPTLEEHKKLAERLAGTHEASAADEKSSRE